MIIGTIHTDIGSLTLKFNGFWNNERDRFIDYPDNIYYMIIDKSGHVSLMSYPPIPNMDAGYWNFGNYAPFDAWRSDIIGILRDGEYNGYDRETDGHYLDDWYHHLYIVTGRQLLEFEHDARP